MKRPTITIELTQTVDGDDVEVRLELPAKWQICERCHGTGKVDNPAFSNGITEDEWNGPDWGPDEREAYLSGRYDTSCGCGDGKVLVVDEARVGPDQAAMIATWAEAQEQDRREAEQDRRTQMAECGIYN